MPPEKGRGVSSTSRDGPQFPVSILPQRAAATSPRRKRRLWDGQLTAFCGLRLRNVYQNSCLISALFGVGIQRMQEPRRSVSLEVVWREHAKLRGRIILKWICRIGSRKWEMNWAGVFWWTSSFMPASYCSMMLVNFVWTCDWDNSCFNELTDLRKWQKFKYI